MLHSALHKLTRNSNYLLPWPATWSTKSCKDVVFPTVGCAFPARNGTQHRLSKVVSDEDTTPPWTGREGRMNCWKRSHASRMGRLCYAEWNMCRSVGSGWWWWSCCGRIEICTCHKFWRSGLVRRGNFVRRKNKEVCRELRRDVLNFNSLTLWFWKEIEKFKGFFLNLMIVGFGWKIWFTESLFIN